MSVISPLNRSDLCGILKACRMMISTLIFISQQTLKLWKYFMNYEERKLKWKEWKIPNFLVATFRFVVMEVWLRTKLNFSCSLLLSLPQLKHLRDYFLLWLFCSRVTRWGLLWVEANKKLFFVLAFSWKSMWNSLVSFRVFPLDVTQILNVQMLAASPQCTIFALLFYI